jgi:hypothetical protein
VLALNFPPCTCAHKGSRALHGAVLQRSIEAANFWCKACWRHHMVSSMIADTMSPSADLSARMALGLDTPACARYTCSASQTEPLLQLPTGCTQFRAAACSCSCRHMQWPQAPAWLAQFPCIHDGQWEAGAHLCHDQLHVLGLHTRLVHLALVLLLHGCRRRGRLQVTRLTLVSATAVVQGCIAVSSVLQIVQGEAAAEAASTQVRPRDGPL